MRSAPTQQSPGLLCPTVSAAGAAGVGWGWKMGQQNHSLLGNVVINFNRAPAKDLAGLHRAVKIHTLARHEACGEERAAHTPGYWEAWDLVGASALPQASQAQNTQGFGAPLQKG